MKADGVLIRRPEVVRIYLAILESLLREQPSISQAIRASISLRFLIDGSLNRIAHELGIAIRIPTPDLNNVPIRETIVFACGGYTIGGSEIGPYYAYRKPGLRSPRRPQFDKQVSESPRTHTLLSIKLGAFLQMPCLSIAGVTFTREEITRYVANKCGGAHHHNETNSFDEIEHKITAAGQVLEVNGRGLSAVFLETVGTAWYLLNAPDIQHLRSALEN